MLLTRSVLAIWHSWVLIYFPIAWFFQLEANAYSLARGVQELRWASHPMWHACNEGKGEPKRKMRKRGRWETTSPYIALLRIRSPRKQNSWLSLLHICGCTRQNAAVNRSMIFILQPGAGICFLLFVLICVIVICILKEWMGLEARQIRNGILASLPLCLWLWSRYFTLYASVFLSAK